jgi:purine-nucleoside phosphorylase
VAIRPDLLELLSRAFAGENVKVYAGTVWTTDAPFRETESAIRFYRRQGVVAVEMEAAALYAYAEARAKAIVCLAHVTNRMAVTEGDFEKGRDNGAHDALRVICLIARAWLAAKHQAP